VKRREGTRRDKRVKGWTHLSSCGRWLFVRLPIRGGLYIRTHPCVASVACPTCGAAREEPCKSGPRDRDQGPKTEAHYQRRYLASGRKAPA